MAITHVGSGTGADGSSAGSAVGVEPTGSALNDIIVSWCIFESTEPPANLSPPSGWTPIGSPAGTPSFVYLGAYIVRPAGAPSYTWTFTSGTGHWEDRRGAKSEKISYSFIFTHDVKTNEWSLLNLDAAQLP